MEIKKEGPVKFNFSPTSLNTYYQSPLLFYLTYIAKVPDDTRVPVCYGLSGGIVHNALEKYAKGELSRDETYKYLIEEWERLRLHIHKDMKDQVLNQQDYLMALIKGLQIVDDHNDHVCEEMISFPQLENETFKIGVKGIIDLQAKEKLNNELVIIDYKTSNSVNQSKDFERQALFYNYLLHKKKGTIPEKTVFHYLKLNTAKAYQFNESDLTAFEKELTQVTAQIQSYSTDIGKYPLGKIDDVFNSKRKACEEEMQRRLGYRNLKTFVQMRF